LLQKRIMQRTASDSFSPSQLALSTDVQCIDGRGP
jgi:hypothetical protein